MQEDDEEAEQELNNQDEEKQFLLTDHPRLNKACAFRTACRAPCCIVAYKFMLNRGCLDCSSPVCCGQVPPCHFGTLVLN